MARSNSRTSFYDSRTELTAYARRRRENIKNVYAGVKCPKIMMRIIFGYRHAGITFYMEKSFF